MTVVRPPVWPTVPPPASGGAGDARQSARGAFFEQALGRATEARPQVQTPAVRAGTTPQPHAERVRTTFTAPQDPPQKILRPGSLLDIKV
ncbi:MAG: hypothetical protein Q7J28_16840 [Caulobacter sp.]|nr:hypothetical protein [Caulobacter sp.]